MINKNAAYIEPNDYFPEETRKKYKIGEYVESEESKQIKAVMLGHAVGDALGVPVEGWSREELDKSPVTDMQGWGSYPVPEGCWSDDTSMALATLDSLKKGGIDYEEIMQNFAAWCTDDKYTPTGELFDIGKTCLNAILVYMNDKNPALKCGFDDEHSNGNGSLMRIHPMALYLYSKGMADDDGMEIIHNTSELTHAHPRAKIACGIYAMVLWELLKNPCKLSIVNGINKARDYYKVKVKEKEKKEIKDMLNLSELSDREQNELVKMLWSGDEEKSYKSFTKEFKIYDNMLVKRICLEYFNRGNINNNLIPRDEIKSSGYVVDTLIAAIWCILTTNDYKSCVLKAVNLGRDTDTVAGVAGGLAGALYGIDSIPEKWLNTIKRKDYIEEMCEEASAVWYK